jgi:2-hydroxy-3-keto-5-methylthiopentenyl-1-phosphate phosphatase
MRDISIDALKRNKEAFVLLLEYINNLDKILSSRSTLSKVVDFFRAGVKNILSEVKSRAELVELIKKIIKYCDSQIIRIQNNSSPSI